MQTLNKQTKTKKEKNLTASFRKWTQHTAVQYVHPLAMKNSKVKCSYNTARLQYHLVINPCPQHNWSWRSRSEQNIIQKGLTFQKTLKLVNVPIGIFLKTEDCEGMVGGDILYTGKCGIHNCMQTHLSCIHVQTHTHNLTHTHKHLILKSPTYPSLQAHITKSYKLLHHITHIIWFEHKGHRNQWRQIHNFFNMTKKVRSCMVKLYGNQYTGIYLQFQVALRLQLTCIYIRWISTPL